MKENPERQIESSWMANAEAWADAVRAGAIVSRTRGTDVAIIEAVLYHRPGRVLDVGCGEGWLARSLNEHGIQVFGFDISPSLVQHARKGGDGSFVVCTYEEFAAEPHRVGSDYDVAICNFSLFNEKIAPVLQALRSRLVKGGTLLIQTVHPWVARAKGPYVDGWRTESFADFGPDFSEAMPWYYRTLESWVALLYDCGFERVTLREPRDAETGDPLSLLLAASDR